MCLNLFSTSPLRFNLTRASLRTYILFSRTSVKSRSLPPSQDIHRNDIEKIIVAFQCAPPTLALLLKTRRRISPVASNSRLASIIALRSPQFHVPCYVPRAWKWRSDVFFLLFFLFLFFIHICEVLLLIMDFLLDEIAALAPLNLCVQHFILSNGYIHFSSSLGTLFGSWLLAFSAGLTERI